MPVHSRKQRLTHPGEASGERHKSHVGQPGQVDAPHRDCSVEFLHRRHRRLIPTGRTLKDQGTVQRAAVAAPPISVATAANLSGVWLSRACATSVSPTAAADIAIPAAATANAPAPPLAFAPVFPVTVSIAIAFAAARTATANAATAAVSAVAVAASTDAAAASAAVAAVSAVVNFSAAATAAATSAIAAADDDDDNATAVAAATSAIAAAAAVTATDNAPAAGGSAGGGGTGGGGEGGGSDGGGSEGASASPGKLRVPCHKRRRRCVLLPTAALSARAGARSLAHVDDVVSAFALAHGAVGHHQADAHPGAERDDRRPADDGG